MIARSFLLLVGLTLGATGGYYYTHTTMQREMIAQKGEMSDELSHALMQEKIKLTAMQGKLDAAEAQLVIDKATIGEYAAQVKKLQDELSRTSEQLSFYDQLVPAGPQGAVSIRGFDAILEGQRVRVKVLLSRQAQAGTVFKGELKFSAAGTLNGKEATVDLIPDTVEHASSDSDSLPDVNGLKKLSPAPILELDFETIQRIQGLLTVPEGFVPKKITMSVLEGKNVRTTRTIDLSPDLRGMVK